MNSDIANNSKTITCSNFIKAGGLSTEFLKGNGTTDSSTYLTSNR